jgi:hypothetical protein
MNSRKVLEKKKRFNREWFRQDHIAAMRSEETGHIEMKRESDAPSAMLDVADILARLALWSGVCGQLALMDGSSSGWGRDPSIMAFPLSLTSRSFDSVSAGAPPGSIPPNHQSRVRGGTGRGLLGICTAFKARF